jgi:hypothetical protein
MKMFVAALIAAFALSSMAEAATPRKTRHRAKHSSRVSSGAVATTGRKPVAKKRAGTAKARTHAQATGTASRSSAAKAPVRRRPATKPR